MSGRLKRGVMWRIILAITSFLLTAAAVEVFVFYVLDVKPPGYRPDRFLQFDPTLGSSHKPGTRGWWYRYNDGTKFMVSINSYGFSDVEWRGEKAGPRIALIGDSTTECWEAAPEDRPQVLLAKSLGDNVEVLNFGVRGYSTDRAYLLLKSKVIGFAPDIVVYTFCVNDIADNSSTEGKPYFVCDPADSERLVLKGCPLTDWRCSKADHSLARAVDVFARDHSFIYRRSRSLLMSLVGYRWPLETHADLRPFKREYNNEDRARMELTLRLISAMDAYCRANGIRFLLVDSIARWEIDEDARNRLVHMYGGIFDFERISRTLAGYATSHGIEFVSLPDLARERDLTASDLMHREDTIHLDARGIRLFSDRVAEKILSLGWLGPGTQDDSLADLAGLRPGRIWDGPGGFFTTSDCIYASAPPRR